MGGAHEIVKGLQSYMHITEKVRVREWERIQTLWCKGHRGVKPGSTRPPDPTPLWCCSPQDVGPWGGSAWRSPGTGPLPLSQRGPGTSFCPQRKCTWLWVGLGKGHILGTRGERGEIKTNRLGKRIRSLSQPLGGWYTNINLPKEFASLSLNPPAWDCSMSTGTSWHT